jgi:hypothetical protein
MLLTLIHLTSTAAGLGHVIKEYLINLCGKLLYIYLCFCLK